MRSTLIIIIIIIIDWKSQGGSVPPPPPLQDTALVVKPLGESEVKVFNPANGHTSSVKFDIVPENFDPILSSKASQFMKILTLNKINLQPVLQLKLSNVIDDYPDVFKDELEQLPGEAHFITDPSVSHVVSPMRRIPVSITEKVKNELDHLSAKNVTTPVQKPTDWRSKCGCYYENIW